jgi:hypothetical protein
LGGVIVVFFKREAALSRFEEALRGTFSRIREELEDHKESINQNTNEIQTNYEYLCRLEQKIDKLSERLDELSLFMNHPSCGKQGDILELTQNEQKVFVCLYASDDRPLTYHEIASKTGFSENLVVCYIGNLIAKGVPLTKKSLGSRVHLSIEPSFRELQARSNVVKLHHSAAHNMVL